MKKYISQCSSLSRVALLSLFSLIHTYSYTISSRNLISFSGNIALKEEKLISNFFDKANETSWNEFIILFRSEINQLIQKVGEVTRSSADPLFGDAVDFAEYIIQQFNAIIYVFEKHKYNKDNVSAFQNDLESLNFEKTFVVCKEKLEKIKVRAQVAGDKEVIEAVEKLIKALEIKRKEWSVKLTKKLTLMGAIVKRMSLK